MAEVIQQEPTGATKQLPVPPPLSVQQKAQWNDFLQFVEQQGMKGNKVLDDRNQNLGRYMMQKFKTVNPQFNLTYEDVPRVQQSLLDYRDGLVKQYRNKTMQVDESVKSEDDIMKGLSPADGWLGSQTSSHRFPVAKAVSNTSGTTATKDYGVDTEAYDRDRKIKMKK